MRFGKQFGYLLLTVGAMTFLFPVAMTMAASLMTGSEVTSLFSEQRVALRFLPIRASLSQYVHLLLETSEFLGSFWNSVLLAGGITLGAIAISLITAYFFAKARFPGRDALFFIYIIVMIMPFQVTLLPNYMFAKWTGLYNTRWALILPAWFSPQGTFLLKQFIMSLPDEIMEAAVLETNSVIAILTRIVAPAIWPGIMALMLITFAESWNMVEQPLILLESTSKYPLSLILGSLQGDDLTIVFAGSVLYMVPVVILYTAFHEQLAEGLSKVRLSR